MKSKYRPLLFLIKTYRALVFIWAVLVLTVFFLFIDTTPLFQHYPALMFLYIFAAFSLYLLPVTLFMKNEYGKINGVLFTECDPFAYIDIYQSIIDELTKTKKPPVLDYYRLNLSAGLIAAGRHDEAYESLKRFASFKNNRVGKLSYVVYYNNLCSVCLKLGSIDEAEHYLYCLERCVAALSPKDHQKYIKYVNLVQYGVNLAKGIFDNAENFYNEVFSKTASNYESINAKFHLGRVHLHLGDTAHAKEAFEYVISHGNKLHVVEEAKELLARL